MKKLMIITSLFILIFFTGCSSDPHKVFIRFADAAHSEKTDEAIGCCYRELRDKYASATEKEKEALSTMLKFAAPDSPRLIEKEMDKDTAKLLYEGKIYTKKAERETGRMWVEFVREGNEWKIKKMGKDKGE